MRMEMYPVRLLALSSIMCSVLLTGGVLSPLAATAATYYVATTGNDINPGSQAQPFKTIRKGLIVLRTGDTLYLRGGTYVENINSPIQGGTSWSNATTIAAYPGETVTVKPSSGSAVVVLAGTSKTVYQYIIFDRLIFDATNTSYGISQSVSYLS
jgi:hypothetical protein